MPICTIAIPVYNRAQLVRAAIESALAQDMADLEILVIDNASTDGTWDTLQSYHDPRLRLVRNDTNVGLFGNLNRCLELAQGDYICILCSDDRLLPGSIAREIEMFQRHPNLSLVSTRGWFIDENSNRIRSMGDLLPPGIYNSNEMVKGALWILVNYGSTIFNYPSGVLIKREAVSKAGWFDVNMKQLGDMDYYLRILQHGDMAILSDEGCEVMQHTAAITSQRFAAGQHTEEWFTIIDKWQPFISSRRESRRLIQQCSVFSLYYAQFCWRKKQFAAAQAYWQAAQRGHLYPWTWVAALMRFARIQIPLRRHNTLILPIQPYQAL